MKFLILGIFLVFSLGACSSKHNPNGSYERANQASEKAHKDLDKSF